jgi:hypothetical protein
MIVICDESPLLATVWGYLHRVGPLLVLPMSMGGQTMGQGLDQLRSMGAEVELLLIHSNCRFRDGTPGARLLTALLLEPALHSAKKLVYGLDSRETLLANGWERVFQGEALGLFQYMALPIADNSQLTVFPAASRSIINP